MHNEESNGVGEGVKEAALASFVRMFAPAWLPPRHLESLVEALSQPESVARLVFNLGRRYELIDQVRRLTAARATIHGVKATSMILDELAEGVSRG